MVGIIQTAIGKSMVNHCTVGERGCIYIGASAHSSSYTATPHPTGHYPQPPPSPAPITGQVTCPPALQERTVSHQLRPGPGPRPAQARTQAGVEPGHRLVRVTAAWPGKPGYNAQVPHAIIRASKGHHNYPTAQFPQNIIRKKRQTHVYMLSFRNSITHCDAIELEKRFHSYDFL